MLSILATQFVILWAVIDPIGSVPIYLSQTSHMTAKQKRRVAIKAVTISFAILLFFLIIGQILLEAMQIPLPAFQAAGGLVLPSFCSDHDFRRRQTQPRGQNAERKRG